jgi:hypothetical protein
LISFPSIASLFLIFQSAQHWAAKVNQASLRRDPERLWTRAMNCPAPAGFQSELEEIIDCLSKQTDYRCLMTWESFC